MTKNKKTLLIVGIVAAVLLLLTCCCSIVFVIPALNSSNTNNKPTPVVTERNLKFTDTFDDNSHGWTVGTSNNTYADLTRTISGGKYTWTINSKKDEALAAIANPEVERSKSLRAEVTVNQKSATELTNYNLLSFYNDESNYYALKINQKYQQYTVGMVKDGVWKDFVKWTRDAVVNYDKPNTLKVESSAGLHIFYINGTEVYRSKDDSIVSGGVAIAVQAYESGDKGTWEFDNFSFERLQ